MKHLDKPGPGHTGPCQHVELVKLLGLGLGEVHGKAAGGDEGQVVELAEPGHRGQSIGVGDVCFFLTMRCFNDAMFSNS